MFPEPASPPPLLDPPPLPPSAPTPWFPKPPPAEVIVLKTEFAPFSCGPYPPGPPPDPPAPTVMGISPTVTPKPPSELAIGLAGQAAGLGTDSLKPPAPDPPDRPPPEPPPPATTK